MTTSGASIVACPACGTGNRVPRAKLAAGGRCGRCREALFQGRPVTLTSANFDRHATSDLPLVIDFWAAWCGPCRQMAPAFEAAAGQVEPDARFGKLDTEAEQGLAARFAIRSIPSIVIVHKGHELTRTAGAMPLTTLVQWVRQSLPRL
jgi:thioredoxin 2